MEELERENELCAPFRAANKKVSEIMQSLTSIYHFKPCRGNCQFTVTVDLTAIEIAVSWLSKDDCIVFPLHWLPPPDFEVLLYYSVCCHVLQGVCVVVDQLEPLRVQTHYNQLSETNKTM